MDPRQPHQEEDIPTEPLHILKWIERQPVSEQFQLTNKKLTDFFTQAGRTHQASGNACIRLCYFIEQCMKSNALTVKDVVFSSETCVRLFTLYVEWNEKHQFRSMRQVLELVCTLISQNPDKEVSTTAKSAILERAVSIVRHKAAQTLVKPAFKSLECLLGKRAITAEEVVQTYDSALCSHACDAGNIQSSGFDLACDSLIAEAFDWLTFPDVSPAAGKFLVTLFRELKARQSTGTIASQSLSWQRWIRNGLGQNPSALENVKNYLFPPLFKIDRPGSIEFLSALNTQDPMTYLQDNDIESQPLLRLAAIEVGKKYGLIEESSSFQVQKPSKKAKGIEFHEDTIGPLMAYPSDAIRSLTFSVIVSSLSSTQPFTPAALYILRSNMAFLFSDTDAKYRNEILSTTKHMIERLRGATALLHREVQGNLARHGRDAGNKAIKNTGSTQSQSSLADLLHQHQEFLCWYLDFLFGELIPSSSYQRHATSLKALFLLLQSRILREDGQNPPPKIGNNETSWPFRVELFTPATLRLLLDLLMDPFEDVRGLATDILKLAGARDFIQAGPTNLKRSSETSVPQNGSVNLSKQLDKQGLGVLDQFLARAEQLAKRTGRADYADGVSRCYELLYQMLPSLEARMLLIQHLIDDIATKVEVAKFDVGKAVLEAPVHGAFSALNRVFMSISNIESQRGNAKIYAVMWQQMQDKLYGCCSSIWNAVKDVLCNDSPEGHLPLEVEELDTIDTKDVLSYSFRAIHESSNLMRTMTSMADHRWSEGSHMMSKNLLIQIGDLTFDQLSSLRHRGAFSTVSLTFAKVCQVAKSQISAVEGPQVSLLEKYYEGAMKCIFEQASTTRRSAGIPALMTGILSSNAARPSFAAVMTDLTFLATQPVRLSKTDVTTLPQVHALNSLKEIFKSSTLGKRAEEYIPACFQIAADSLSAEIWAIRNCGLLLLRSLIDCLMGTSESKELIDAGWDGRATKFSYEKYPALPKLLLALLDANPESAHSAITTVNVNESVFPALDIIRRAGPPKASEDEIYKRVATHLGSSVWHVRELSAKTVGTLLLQDNWLESIELLLKNCHDSSNLVHGTLLAIRFCLERRFSVNRVSVIDQLPSLCGLLQEFLHSRKSKTTNNYTIAAELELENTIRHIIFASNHDQRARLTELSLLYTSIATQDGSKNGTEYEKTDASLQIAHLRCAVYATVINRDPNVLVSIVESAAANSADLAIAVLKCIPEAYGDNLDEEQYLLLTGAYVTAVEASSSSDVHAVALTDLADLLDRHVLAFSKPHYEICRILQVLESAVYKGLTSPNRLNAEIRVSGWVVFYSSMKQQDSPGVQLSRKHLAAWGKMLSSAGDRSKDFETRYAAALSLRSFFKALVAIDYGFNEDIMIPALFAVYDTLNDDDDEIRHLGAETVSTILKLCLGPIAAQEDLINWLLNRFSTNSTPESLISSLPWIAINRITGSNGIGSTTMEPLLSPADSQLRSALYEDDSLFVEEEQNLYIDEVREITLWCNAYQNLPVDVLMSESDVSNSLIILAQWTYDGLAALNHLTGEDGPLGWTTKPIAFVTCTRILCSARTLLAIDTMHGQFMKDDGTLAESWRGKIKDIVAQLQVFLDHSASTDLHPSLLSELLFESSLHLTQLESLLRSISLRSRPSCWILPLVSNGAWPNKFEETNNNAIPSNQSFSRHS